MPVCRIRPVAIALLGALGLVGTFLFAAPAHSALAVPATLTIRTNTWDTIGLDSNKSTSSPFDTFPAGAQICNTGTVASNPVTATFNFTGAANPNIRLASDASDTSSAQTIGAIAGGACTQAQFLVSIDKSQFGSATLWRNNNKERTYEITASADDLASASTGTRTLYVQQIASQARNSVAGIVSPACTATTCTFVKGQSYSVTLNAESAPNGYEQTQAFLTFPESAFRIEAITTTWSVPAGATTDGVYGDGCGWSANNGGAVGASAACVGPELFTDGKVGGTTIEVVYTLSIRTDAVTTTTGSLQAVIYDLSGGSYHYNSDTGTDGAGKRILVIADPPTPPTTTTTAAPETTTTTAAPETTTTTAAPETTTTTAAPETTTTTAAPETTTTTAAAETTTTTVRVPTTVTRPTISAPTTTALPPPTSQPTLPPATTPPTGPTPAPEVDRWFGDDRTGTAVDVSRQMFEPGVDVVFIARNDVFADALSGGPMAALEEGPVLLVATQAIPAETAAELNRLDPDRIVIFGGTEAVSASVETQLHRFTTGRVERLPGADRYETAALISEQQFPSGAESVYVATGENFADALSGGAAAAKERGPVLLVRSSVIPATTAAELRRLNPARIIVLGGTDVIPDPLAAELGRIAGAELLRVAGPNRYDTAASVSNATFGERIDTVFIASGEDFPDALSATPAAGMLGSPLLLIEGNDLPPQVATELCRLQPRRIVLVGGVAALSEAVEAQLAACLRDE